MSLLRIDHNPSRRQLNVFAVIWLVFFGVIGGIAARNSDSMLAPAVICVVAVVIPAIGFMVPAFLRIVYVGMAYAAFPIGFVVSHLILAVIYYIVLTPIGLLLRLVGYDSMGRTFDANAKSYWCPRDHEDEPKRYFRQF